MRAVGLLGALAALAACVEGEDPNEAERRPAAAPNAWVPGAGTYEFTRSGGAEGLIMLAGDGKYTAAMSGGRLETGLWRREKNASCLVPEERPARKLCYTFKAPDSRGRFGGTAADGGTMTVRRLE